MGVRDMKNLSEEIRKRENTRTRICITRSSSHIGKSERHYQLDDEHRIAVRKQRGGG